MVAKLRQQQARNLGASIALRKDNAMVTNGPRSSLYYARRSNHSTNRKEKNMPRQYQPFEQDFLLVSETELQVRQAMQYTSLDRPIVAIPDEDIWEWENSSLEGEQAVDKHLHLDEEYTTVWESMLERL